MFSQQAVRIALLVTLVSCGLARAQTAPLTPDISTPPTREEIEQAKSKIQKLYDEFLALKAKIPFQIGAGVYLFYYQPVDYTTFASTDRIGQFEVCAFHLKADSE